MTAPSTRRAALELEPGLFWFAMWDGASTPIRLGHCGLMTTCVACDGDGVVMGGTPCGSCQGTGRVKKASPCQGHPTPEEAEQHFREYLVDSAVKLPAGKTRNQCDAKDCRKRVEFNVVCGFAGTDHEYCAEHCTREQYAADIADVDISDT